MLAPVVTVTYYLNLFLLASCLPQNEISIVDSKPKMVWSKKFDNAVNVIITKNGKFVVLKTADSAGKYLKVLDSKDGSEIWSTPPSDNWCLFMFNYDQSIVYYRIAEENTITGVRVSDGKVLKKYLWPQGFKMTYEGEASDGFFYFVSSDKKRICRYQLGGKHKIETVLDGADLKADLDYSETPAIRLFATGKKEMLVAINDVIAIYDREADKITLTQWTLFKSGFYSSQRLSDRVFVRVRRNGMEKQYDDNGKPITKILSFQKDRSGNIPYNVSDLFWTNYEFAILPDEKHFVYSVLPRKGLPGRFRIAEINGRTVADISWGQDCIRGFSVNDVENLLLTYHRSGEVSVWKLPELGRQKKK